MKRGRPTWSRRAGKATLQRIRAAAVAGDDPSVLFVKFNLQQYGCTLRTFRRHVAMWKRDYTGRIETPETERAATADDLLQSLLDAVQVDIDAGRPLDGKMGDLIRATVAARKLDFEREAERRASEKHEAWKTELLRKQAQAADELGKAHGMTPELLAEIKSKVLGI